MADYCTCPHKAPSQHTLNSDGLFFWACSFCGKDERLPPEMKWVDTRIEARTALLNSTLAIVTEDRDHLRDRLAEWQSKFINPVGILDKAWCEKFKMDLKDGGGQLRWAETWANIAAYAQARKEKPRTFRDFIRWLTRPFRS